MKRITNNNPNKIRQLRHSRVRARVAGTAAVPRLSVFRGLSSIVAQLIDDAKGNTLCQVRSQEITPVAVAGKSAKVALAYQVGEQLAVKARAQGITKTVFDRGGYRFHGRVAAVAEGARAGGLQF